MFEKPKPKPKAMSVRTGTTVCMVEQSVRKALAVADHSYVLEHGCLVAQGKAPLLARSGVIRNASLGATSPPNSNSNSNSNSNETHMPDLRGQWHYVKP